MKRDSNRGSYNIRFQVNKDKIRKRLLKYTRKAFRIIPRMDEPRILDIGCGSGIPTLELARLGQGAVTGIDIDQSALDRFAGRIEEADLGNHVQVINCSMREMHFANKSYDIIWAEGSIYAIGFEEGLREWRTYLKPGGYVVIHDEQGNIHDKLKQISSYGYEVLQYFVLSKEDWWKEYFEPLEKLINEFRPKYSRITDEIKQAEQELYMFKKDPEHNCSVYFVLRDMQGGE
jgi:ubiquinone/menaquinone biosynthesis C-methylase UbiE